VITRFDGCAPVDGRAWTHRLYQRMAVSLDFVYAFTKTYCGVSTHCQCLRAMEVDDPERSR